MTPEQLKQLQEAILHAFTEDDLRQVVFFEFGQNLTAHVGKGPFKTVVFDVLTWTEREGRTRDLVEAVRKARPENEKVQAVTGELLAWLPSGRPARRPEYRDEFRRRLGEQAEGLRRRRRDLLLQEPASSEIQAVEAQLADLKRQMRHGPLLKVGDCLSERFLLLREVGRGGFATVWNAYDEVEGKTVAVKVLHSQFSDTAEQRERFESGARVKGDFPGPACCGGSCPRCGRRSVRMWVSTEDRGHQEARFEATDGDSRTNVQARFGSHACSSTAWRTRPSEERRPRSISLGRRKSARIMSYHIYRRNWRCSSTGRWSHLPGHTRLATYASAAKVKNDLQRREANARSRVNPFAIGGVGELTTLPFPVFRDLLWDLGLTPAPHEYPGWFGWWAKLGEEQRLRLWEVFDKVRFYEVMRGPRAPVGYAVLALNWTRDDHGTKWLSDEGGVLRGVYRSRDAIDGYYDSSPGCRRRWLPADEDPFDPETHWRNYVSPRNCDVVQVDLEGKLREPSDRKEHPIHVVVRRVWCAGDDAPQPLETERVPLCCFSDRKSAERRCRELNAAIPGRHDLCDLFSGRFDDQDADAFFAAVEHLDLPAPDFGVPKWWFENRDEITPEQRLAMWKLFPECRVYEVVGSRLFE